ncbi:pgsA [Symbiodinium sp. CCMP2592]|nr:pgsA [Symbiodinium sp. CCMP2592]
MDSAAFAMAVAKPRENLQGVMGPPPAVARREFELLPTYHRLLQYGQEDCRSGSDDGIAVDVPAWATSYLASGATEMRRSILEIGTDEVQALVDSVLVDSTDFNLIQEFPDFQENGQAIEASPTARQPKRKPKEPPKRQLKETRWGRCLAPWCRQLALQPALGSRGPFLVCSAKSGCRFKKDLSAAQWRTLPAEWLKYWPISWAAVKPWLRPLRPVASLGSSRHVRPRRISWRRAVQASQDHAASSQELLDASLSQASSGGA